MKAVRYFLPILIISLFISGCNILDGAIDGPVQIRLANQSERDMDNITVSFPDAEVDYGAVKAGDKSIYRSTEKAYRYAYIEVMINGRKLILQPIDYVGESPLKEGKYTYHINIIEENFEDETYPYALTIGFTKDKN